MGKMEKLNNLLDLDYKSKKISLRNDTVVKMVKSI